MKCSFLMTASLNWVSVLTILSMVLLLAHISSRLIIISKVLQVQLFKAMFVISKISGIFLFFRIEMVVACLQKAGMLLEIQIFLHISRRYFKNIVGSSLRRW